MGEVSMTAQTGTNAYFYFLSSKCSKLFKLHGPFRSLRMSALGAKGLQSVSGEKAMLGPPQSERKQGGSTSQSYGVQPHSLSL